MRGIRVSLMIVVCIQPVVATLYQRALDEALADVFAISMKRKFLAVRCLVLYNARASRV